MGMESSAAAAALAAESSAGTTKTRHVRWASDLHSEYRSTYRWHEYKGAAAAGGGGGAGGAGGVVRQPAPQQPASLPHRDMFGGRVEPAMPRRKKYPGVAYKTNELFDASAAPPERLTSVAAVASTLDRARSVERNESRPGAGRRSKSEGPRQQRWTDTIETKGPATGAGLGEPLASKEAEASTEYRNQFAWPKDAVEAGAAAPRKSCSMGATEMEPLMNHGEDNVNEDHASKKYIEDYLWNGNKPGVPRKSTFRSALSAFISNGEDRSKDNRKRYKSEYKKKFRPFSQYVFEASKGTFTKCRGLKVKAGSLEREEGSTERMLPPSGAGAGEVSGSGPGTPGLQPAPALHDGESWYREVLDSRKRAGEYKYRGWGTELAPDHITQLYNKQIELWYQVSRRSSLSALSLAATNHKALAAGEREAAEAKSRSPKKVKSFRAAPHTSVHAKLQETRQLERSPQKLSPQKVQRKKLQGHSFDETATANEGKSASTKEGTAPRSPRKQPNVVVGPGAAAGGAASPAQALTRSPRRRPRSADPKPAAAAAVAAPPMVNGHEPPRPRKPTGLPLNSRVKSTTKKTTAKTPSPTTVTANSAKRRSRSVSKVGIKLESEGGGGSLGAHRSVSVAKDHVFDETPVVKSPPEPTRVKSPEQMNMRSPDPVNWTVPLDTGKSFTVTQNVKSDDNTKRPSSEFKGMSICEEPDVASEGVAVAVEAAAAAAEELAPVHHQLSPKRRLKKSDSPTTSGHKRAERDTKTPNSTASLTPIDETRPLETLTNGDASKSPLEPSVELPNDSGTTEYPDANPEPTKKSTEASQRATGEVGTALVGESPAAAAFSAAEVLERARTRFDKFWGKQEEDSV